jgi:hypothetical protein
MKAHIIAAASDCKLPVDTGENHERSHGRIIKTLANPCPSGYPLLNPGSPKVQNLKIDQEVPLARRQSLFAGFLVEQILSPKEGQK